MSIVYTRALNASCRTLWLVLWDLPSQLVQPAPKVSNASWNKVSYSRSSRTTCSSDQLLLSVTPHSQKVPIHNQDVYCFEWVIFPSALFLLATESSWEAFDGSVMNLKVVLKTFLQLLFHQPNRLDSAGICHRERRLSPHLALSWESHSNFRGWALRGQT